MARLTPWVWLLAQLWLALAVVIALQSAQLRRRLMVKWTHIFDGLPHRQLLSPITAAALISLISLLLLSALIQFLTPLTALGYGDERMYHASRVMYWRQFQTIFPYVTHNDRQVVFPFGGELFFLWPILFTKTELVGRMVFWLGYPLALAGLYLLLRALRVSSTYAVMGCLVFAATPIVARSSTGLKPELWLVVFLLGLAFWIVQSFEQPARRLNLFGVGLFLALSINVKFTALALLWPILLIPWRLKVSARGSLAAIGLGLGLGVLCSGLIVTFGFNLAHYGQLLGPVAMQRVHASDLSLIQLYTHAVRLPFLLLEFPLLPSTSISEALSRWGNTIIAALGAATPLPLENQPGWPGAYAFSLPLDANKFSLPGLVWLPMLAAGLISLASKSRVSRLGAWPILVISDCVLLISIVFLVRWMTHSGLPERFLIAPYALGVAIGAVLVHSLLNKSKLSRAIAVLLIAVTIYPPLRGQYVAAKAALAPFPLASIQQSWPFAEALDYIPLSSRILLIAGQDVPDYPLFRPEQHNLNQVISWGKSPFDPGRLADLIEKYQISHILIQNDVRLDFHWDPPLSTVDLAAWLRHQPQFSEAPLTSGSMRLFESLKAKQIRQQETRQAIQNVLAHAQPVWVEVEAPLQNQIALDIAEVDMDGRATQRRAGALQLGQGDRAGLLGALWSTEARAVLIRLEVAPAVAGHDLTYVIQLTGLVHGQLLTLEQSLTASTRLDFPVALKAGPNRFLVTASAKSPHPAHDPIVDVRRIVIQPLP